MGVLFLLVEQGQTIAHEYTYVLLKIAQAKYGSETL